MATPVGNLAGFRRYLPHDAVAGFLVFLIALPLCLGIALASGYPPLAGIFTAAIGAVVTTFISNSELTIKGPAAGLIVVAVGCIADFGGDGTVGGFSEIDLAAYRAALAVGLAAAVLQIGFALLRWGVLGEFFPTAVVHGMLAAIGLIIMIKQFPIVLGVSAGGEPLEMLREILHYLSNANPAITSIGLVSLAILFVWPAVGRRFPTVEAIPAPLVVLGVSVAMGAWFGLVRAHTYEFVGHEYQLGEQHLVPMPDRVFGLFDAMTTPDIAALGNPKAWKWVVVFFAIGSLESILSVRAIDRIDPWKRKTNMDRDVLAIGVANLGASLVGGLPMISEIVRSKANVDNGACTRFANFWHGCFLFACVALAPMLLHRIPLAALAAMLVFTGFRLAHPNEFRNALRVGKEQLAVFSATLVAVLATDLLVGVAIGIALKIMIHVVNGVSVGSLFGSSVEVLPIEATKSRIVVREPVLFSNWIAYRRRIEQVGLGQRHDVILDLTRTERVDPGVVENLEQMQTDFSKDGLHLELEGLDALAPWAKN